MLQWRAFCTPGKPRRRPHHRRVLLTGMRSNDGSFAALVLIEGLDEAAVRAALHHLRAALPEADHAGIDDLPLYRLAFSLPKRLLPG
jgi:hypothetical protein